MLLFFKSLWFQLCWFVAVLGTEDWQWLTLTLALLTLIYCAIRSPHSLKMISKITVIGWLLDTLNQQVSIFVFPSQTLPLWLLCLWFLFAWYACQFQVVLLKYRASLVCLVGALGGGVSYFAGSSLGAVSFGFSVFMSITIILIEWFLLMLLILKVCRDEYES